MVKTSAGGEAMGVAEPAGSCGILKKRRCWHVMSDAGRLVLRCRATISATSLTEWFVLRNVSQDWALTMSAQRGHFDAGQHPHFLESDGSGEHVGGGGGGSIRSSDGGGSFSGYDDVTEERKRIEQKMDQIKERLARISIAREADVDDFLSMASNLRGGQENPQVARVRQHFEKKNKKHAQEMEHLQKKLELLQAKLCELDMGIVVEPSPRSAMLNNIRKTGPLLREVTDSVIAAPRGIAHIIKNTFGSADNIPDAVNEDASSVGHSKFYSGPSGDENRERGGSQKGSRIRSMTGGDAGGVVRHRVETLPAIPFDLGSVSNASDQQGHEDTTDTVKTAPEGSLTELRDEIHELKGQNQTLLDQINKIQNFAQTEFNFFNNALHEERIKSQRLEEALNETIELHQAEMISLKSDLNMIGTRMDYQYCDRFRSIEEKIESTQNSVIRMEGTVKEWTEVRPQSLFAPVLLSGANILVELLKLVLFLVSVALDFVKPLTGTRTRAGFAILVWIVLMVVMQYVDFFAVFRKLSLFRVAGNSSISL